MISRKAMPSFNEAEYGVKPGFRFRAFKPNFF